MSDADIAAAAAVPAEPAQPADAATPNPSGAPATGDATEGDAVTGGTEEADSSKSEVPETYEAFTMPDGVTIDAEMLASASPVFKDLGLTQDQAQKLVDYQASQTSAAATKQTDDFNQMIDGWTTQSQNDKEFGGDKFEENVAVARQAIDKFGTPELKTLLSDHGVGSHPEVIRFMVKVGKLTAEKPIDGGGRPVSPQADRTERLYPKT